MRDAERAFREAAFAVGEIEVPHAQQRVRVAASARHITPRQQVTVEATADDGTTTTFEVLARIDAPAEVDYLRHGGILPMVLRRMIADAPPA